MQGTEETLYIAFINLTKAFDFVNRDGLFQILNSNGYPTTLLSMIELIHKNMKGTFIYDGSVSKSFDICCGVKQGCILATKLFSIFFAVLPKHAFESAMKGIYLRTRSDGSLFNLSRLKAKSKCQMKCLCEFLFADDVAITSHHTTLHRRPAAPHEQVLHCLPMFWIHNQSEEDSGTRTGCEKTTINLPLNRNWMWCMMSYIFG